MSVDEMQFGFMPEKGITDVVFILRRMQEECHASEKSCICVFVDLENAFDRVPGSVLVWALRKKEMPDVWLDQ